MVFNCPKCKNKLYMLYIRIDGVPRAVHTDKYCKVCSKSYTTLELINNETKNDDTFKNIKKQK